MFVCGGLRGGNLLGDMYVSEEPPSEAGVSRADAMAALSEVIDLQAPAWQRWLGDVGLLDEAAKIIKTLPPRPPAEDATGGRAGSAHGNGGGGGASHSRPVAMPASTSSRIPSQSPRV